MTHEVLYDEITFAAACKDALTDMWSGMACANALVIPLPVTTARPALLIRLELVEPGLDLSNLGGRMFVRYTGGNKEKSDDA